MILQVGCRISLKIIKTEKQKEKSCIMNVQRIQNYVNMKVLYLMPQF